MKTYKFHAYVQKAVLGWRNNQDTAHRGKVDIVGAYLLEAGAYRQLTAADEVELFADIEQGFRLYGSLGIPENPNLEQNEIFMKFAAAHQTVFHTNLKLVISISKIYWRATGIPEIDTIQEGNIGLNTALNRFDANKGFKFSTYATNWIHQAIRRSIANSSRAIRLPVHRHDTFLKLTSRVKKLANELGRELTEKEIEASTGMRINKYYELQHDGRSHLPSLDSIIKTATNSDPDNVFGNFIADKNADMNREITYISDRDEIKRLLDDAEMSDREKVIVGLRYGLSPETVGPLTVNLKGHSISYEQIAQTMQTTKGLSLEQLGEIFKVTRERIRQLEKAGIKRLREVSSMQNGERL